MSPSTFPLPWLTADSVASEDRGLNSTHHGLILESQNGFGLCYRPTARYSGHIGAQDPRDLETEEASAAAEALGSKLQRLQEEIGTDDP